MMQYKNIFSALMLLGILVMASSCGEEDLTLSYQTSEGEIGENTPPPVKAPTSNLKIDNQEIDDSERNRATSVATRATFSQELENDDQDLKDSTVGALFLAIKNANVNIPSTHALIQNSPPENTDNNSVVNTDNTMTFKFKQGTYVGREMQKVKGRMKSKMKAVFMRSKDDKSISTGKSEELTQDAKMHSQNLKDEPHTKEQTETIIRTENEKNLNTLKSLFVVLGHVFAAKEKSQMIDRSPLESFIVFGSHSCTFKKELLGYAVPEKWKPVVSDIGKLLEHVGTELELTTAIQESSPKQTSSDDGHSHVSKESTKRPEKKAKKQEKEIKKLNKKCEESISEQKRILQAAINHINQVIITDKTALDGLFEGPIKAALEGALKLYTDAPKEDDN